MPTSVLTCELDRTTSDLGSYETDLVNGVAGTYTVRYNVTTASACGPPSIMLNGVSASPNPLPSLWATYSYQGDTDPYSFAKSFKFERDAKSKTRYYVTVTYKPAEPGEIPDYVNTATANGSPIKSEPNPFLRSPVYWWDREMTTVLVNTDANGYAIRGYNNDRYEDLLELDYPRSILVIEFPVHSNNEFIALDQKYNHAVNSTAWTFKLVSYPPRTVLCKDVSCSPIIEEGSYRYYTVTMRFAFAPQSKTWDIPVPEMGRSYYTKTNGVYDVDSSGFKVRKVVDFNVPLEADGTRRTDDQPVLITNVRAYREYDFNQLTSGNAWNLV